MATSPSVPADCFLGEDDYATYDKQLKDCVKKGTYGAVRSVLEAIISKYDAIYVEDKVNAYLNFIKKLDNQSNEFSKHLNIDPRNVTCRYQGYASRGGEPLKVFAQLYMVHKACKNDSKKLLVGCNIVAAENGEKSMLYYRLHMEMLAVLADQFPTVKTSLHAGELTLGLGRPEHLTYHISEALKTAKAHRIGHGVDLPFESDYNTILGLMSLKKSPIPVEINLTSNEFILGVKDSEHPIKLYHKAGVPIIISTDDPGILRTSLTEQYTLATLRYGFSYAEIRRFAFNSIEYGFTKPDDKIELSDNLYRLLNEFEKKF